MKIHRKKIQCNVVVVFSIPGLHYWAEAPKQTDYLRNPHRHQFGIEASFAVSDNNRQVEYFDIEEQIMAWLREMYWDGMRKLYYFGAMSCEQIAQAIQAQFKCTEVRVSEDGGHYSMVR